LDAIQNRGRQLVNSCVDPISRFINERPTIKMIALSFLVAIGIMLIAEAFGEHLQKGYIYFALVYALVVEMLNLRMRKNQKK
jgi:predicted tellurium resistance membrane protein TerC